MDNVIIWIAHGIITDIFFGASRFTLLHEFLDCFGTIATALRFVSASPRPPVFGSVGSPPD
jgi:hypothetical protein